MSVMQSCHRFITVKLISCPFNRTFVSFSLILAELALTIVDTAGEVRACAFECIMVEGTCTFGNVLMNIFIQALLNLLENVDEFWLLRLPVVQYQNDHNGVSVAHHQIGCCWCGQSWMDSAKRWWLEILWTIILRDAWKTKWRHEGII